MKTETSSRGFTLIEMLVVMAIFLAVALLSFPKILSIANRSRIEGTAQQTAMLMRSARLKAIRMHCYGVVKIDPAARKVLAFADLDRDGEFEPQASPRDVLVGVIDLPQQVSFLDDEGDEGLDSVRDFDNPDAPIDLPDQQAIYQDDGTILSTGALRFADNRGNLLEVNVGVTSGLIEIRKYEGTKYVRKGEGSLPWTFK